MLRNQCRTPGTCTASLRWKSASTRAKKRFRLTMAFAGKLTRMWGATYDLPRGICYWPYHALELTGDYCDECR